MNFLRSVVLVVAIMLMVCNSQANADLGHGSVRLFEGVEFDTIPHDVVAGQKVEISFRLKLRDDYRIQIQGTYDFFDSATIDSQPILLTISAAGWSGQLDSTGEVHTTLGIIELDEGLLKDVVLETTFQHASNYISHDFGIGGVRFNTNLREIIAGKCFKFSLIYPNRGICDLNINSRYYRRCSWNELYSDDISLNGSGNLSFLVR